MGFEIFIDNEGNRYTDEEILINIFSKYEETKKDPQTYEDFQHQVKKIVMYYYKTFEKPEFDGLLTNFKNRYIYNENKLEEVHEPEEIEGLASVYDHIQSKIEEKNINIYLLLILHNILYSKTPYPEFGGDIRTNNCYLSNSSIETEDFQNIGQKLSDLYNYTKELAEKGIKLGKEKDINKIMDYVDECIILNAELIRIHPFTDGNGRITRSFLNIYFKLAGIPPTYIEPREQIEYQKAMRKAIIEKDYKFLQQFYYFKICDSIYELDIVNKIKNKDKPLSRTLKKTTI